MIRVAIVDDEPEVLKQLEEYIREYSNTTGQIFEIALFSDGDEIMKDYGSNYDIIFLDIQMNCMDGMTTAEQIRAMDDEVILIFITNMAHYAIRGYSVDAMDFVLKPVPYFAFSQELQKAVNRLKKREKVYIPVPIDGGILRLDVTEIYYIESFGHRLLIHTKKDKHYLTDTMKNLEQKLTKHSFFRCNHCYLVNLAHVESVNHYTINAGCYKLQVSRPKRKAFMEALTDYIGGVAK